ncbi:type I glyceraldehyde-3-phosphate dehydrogenase [Patescibacteria group bacterium]|nr:type I glyceraldehyde-3-phosphate dehydrogenase [Patescibacteria group bacterium]
MSLRIAINGFGRIGRAALKVALTKKDIKIVALNDLTDNKTLAHLLQYDTVYGKFDKKVSYNDNSIIVDGQEYPVLSEKEPAKLPWSDLKIDIVIESTGRFRTEEEASAHITAGAKRVIISAPAKGGNVQTFVMGVNNNQVKDQKIISNASCTTNCIAPVAAILHGKFGVKKASMTTIHSYTADQNIVDGPHKDLRRARAAAQNIIPTTTGAAAATTETIPELAGLFDGLAIRVPTPIVSLSDLTILLKKKVTVEDINNAFKQAVKKPLYMGVVEVTEEPLVSSDLIGNPHTSIVDLSLTKVIDGDLVKVIAWYDNEWGYANALVKMCQEIGNNL